jgi:hypothetical protein
LNFSYFNTPGAWNDSPTVRANAAPYTEEFKECVALQSQYIYDLDFYDHYFKPGSYLTTHKEHMKNGTKTRDK